MVKRAKVPAPAHDSVSFSAGIVQKTTNFCHRKAAPRYQGLTSFFDGEVLIRTPILLYHNPNTVSVPSTVSVRRRRAVVINIARLY